MDSTLVEMWGLLQGVAVLGLFASVQSLRCQLQLELARGHPLRLLLCPALVLLVCTLVVGARLAAAGVAGPVGLAASFAAGGAMTGALWGPLRLTRAFFPAPEDADFEAGPYFGYRLCKAPESTEETL